MAPFWDRSFGNPHSNDHAVGWNAHQAVDAAATSVAALIGADADEIIFTSGATEANNFALFGLSKRAPAARSRILVSAVEHKCVLAASRIIAEQEGLTVETIPVNQEGMLDLNAFETALRENVLMVSIMAVNNEVGAIQALPRISEILSNRNIPLHCDAAQAPCAMDVKDLTNYADMISLSAHKMYGPQGIGALYIRRELQQHIEPLIHGGGQQRGLRSGTLPLALCVGMGAAAELFSSSETSSERARIASQRDRFIRLLKEGGARVSLNGPPSDNRHPGNANICFEGHEAEDILVALQPHLAASTGAACASGIPELSHVLCAMGLSVSQCAGSIRFSFGRFTSDDDICNAAKLILETLPKSISPRPLSPHMYDGF